MDVNQIHTNPYKKIKTFLVFFSLIMFLSCQQEKGSPRFRIDYDNQKATQIVFQNLEVSKDYKVRLKGSSTSIFGNFKPEGEDLIFKPIIPFTGGKTYEIYTEEEVYLEFSVREAEHKIRPRLLGIYPKLDTVPENLLKMYLVFDKPMQQSQSTLDFIKVFNQTTEKEVEVFLPLENELWNADKTELTLWLDPGRIKKDLIPNQEKGIPIEKGNDYEMVIENGLSDKDGTELGKPYVKRFHVGKRDETRPNKDQWKITKPSFDTREGLGISFGESMDVMLIEESIQIIGENNEVLEGGFLPSKKGTSVLFIPEKLWKKQTYKIAVSSTIEDLAGNNLYRLFDVDLKADDQNSLSGIGISFIYFDVD